MNTTPDCTYEGCEPREQSVTNKICPNNMVSYCAQCCNTADYSVKSLRKMFLFNNNQEAVAEVKPTSANIERLPECKCGAHTEEKRLQGKNRSNEQLSETRSVQELRHLFETKMKSSSTNGSMRTYSRPVSAKTDDRQDTLSMDPPHPEGHIIDAHSHSKPCTRWNIANTAIVDVPNGMQITFTVMNDSKH